MTQKQSLDRLIVWLAARHQKVMEHEHLALEELAKGDKAAYEKQMQQKAHVLAQLEEGGQPFLADLDSGLRNRVEAALASFSRSARTSLQLGSTFYMSALLYNDDHKQGEPDNLKVFIDSLAL